MSNWKQGYGKGGKDGVSASVGEGKGKTREREKRNEEERMSRKKTSETKS